ncbi:MAG: hypothetical protein ACR2NQ_00305 [Thermodesulfobacteriota bacterium]
MKYVKLLATLIFVIAGAVVYFGNTEWMKTKFDLSFESVALLYDIDAVTTTGGAALGVAFLLGMAFTLIYSSLNWIELAGRNRKIRKLEREAGRGGKNNTEDE